MLKQDETGRVNDAWKKLIPRNPDGTVEPKYAGFVTTSHGTSCAGCQYLIGGHCKLLAGQPKVQPGNCCVLGDTMIIGDNVRIADIGIGAHTVGLTTANNEVKKTFVHSYRGQIIEVKGAGMLPLAVTPEHQVLVYDGDVTNTNRTIIAEEPHWIEAKNLVVKKQHERGHFMVIPRLTGFIDNKPLGLDKFARRGYRESSTLEFPLNGDTAWFLGLYVAEGWKMDYKFGLSLHCDETTTVNRILEIAQTLGFKCTPSDVPNEKALRLTCYSAILGRALQEWCGEGATAKIIPDFMLFNRNISLLMSFLSGYLEGDGYVSKNGVMVHACSRTLMLQLQLAFARLGRFGAIYRYDSDGASGHGYILGRAVTRHQAYYFYLRNNPSGRTSFKVTETEILTPVKRISRAYYNGKVYNIATTDNTFLASNIAIHNCDFWEKRKGASALVRLESGLSALLNENLIHDGQMKEEKIL